MNCSSCGVENPAGSKFCHECGSPLARACPSCGAAVLPAAKFCHECGTTLSPSPQTQPAAFVHHWRRRPTTSSGMCSVLFCDLVGFTPFSEKRDPEEVRELLSGYFDLARAIVARYGGTVEKFIGDAVMAVWGAPVAKEDDAERAVRAGLELVSAVAAYGAEHGTELQARVGSRHRRRGHDLGRRRACDRRSRQHRRPHPVRGPARLLLCRRDDPRRRPRQPSPTATLACTSSRARPSTSTSSRPHRSSPPSRARSAPA